MDDGRPGCLRSHSGGSAPGHCRLEARGIRLRRGLLCASPQPERGLVADARTRSVRRGWSRSMIAKLWAAPARRFRSRGQEALDAESLARARARRGAGGSSSPPPSLLPTTIERRLVASRAGAPGVEGSRHISPDTLRERLNRSGIERSPVGRHAALLGLAARLPAPILAERVGVHQARAAQCVRIAGCAYADDVAARQVPPKSGVLRQLKPREPVSIDSLSNCR